MSNLSTLRKQQNLSQGKLAENAGVSVRMIQFYEQGIKDINMAAAITIYKLAQVLNCSMEDLIEPDRIARTERK